MEWLDTEYRVFQTYPTPGLLLEILFWQPEFSHFFLSPHASILPFSLVFLFLGLHFLILTFNFHPLPVFCHSKFLHLGAFLVIILLLSVFVCGFFFFFVGERGWRRVTSSHEPVSLAGLGKNDQSGLTQISFDLIVSQYICALRWACGKEQLVPMPSSACPEVPWKPLAPFVEVSSPFQEQPSSETSLHVIQSLKAPSRHQVSHPQASSSPTFNLLSPDKVALCPGWRLHFPLYSALLLLLLGHCLRDLSALTRDWTHAPCSGSLESLPLDHQGSLNIYTLTGRISLPDHERRQLSLSVAVFHLSQVFCFLHLPYCIHKIPAVILNWFYTRVWFLFI